MSAAENPLPRYSATAWVPAQYRGVDAFQDMVEIYYLEPVFSILRVRYRRDRWLPDSEWMAYLQVTERLTDLLTSVLEEFVRAMNGWLEGHYEGYFEQWAEEQQEYWEPPEDEIFGAIQDHFMGPGAWVSPGLEKVGGSWYFKDQNLFPMFFAEFENDFAELKAVFEEVFCTGTPGQRKLWPKAITTRCEYIQDEWYELCRQMCEEGEIPFSTTDEEEEELRGYIDSLTRRAFSNMLYITDDEPFEIVWEKGDVQDHLLEVYREPITEHLRENMQPEDLRETFEDMWRGGEFTPIAPLFMIEVDETESLLRDDALDADDWVGEALVQFHYLKTLEHHGGTILQYMEMDYEHLAYLSELGDEAFELAERMRLKLPVGVRTSA